jgi:hypothetical protein
MRSYYQKDCLARVLDLLARSHVSGEAAYPAAITAGSRVCREVYILLLQYQAAKRLLTWAEWLKG